MKRNDSKEWFRDLTRRLGKLKYPIVVFLFGLILLAIPFGNSQKQVENKQSSQAPAEIVEDTDESSLQDLENRLEQILSQVEGAGRVQVMLRYAAGEKTIYQTDSSQETVTGAEEKQVKMTMETVFASGGSSQETPVVTQVLCPTFQGALIVAEGAGSASVRLDLVNAVSSLTGLGAGKITVIKMK